MRGLLLAAALTTASCGSDPGTSRSAGEESPGGRGGDGAAHQTSAQPGSPSSCDWSAPQEGLRLGLCPSKRAYRLGGDVIVEVRLENAGPETVRVCIGCQGLWAFAIMGPGSSSLGVPAQIALPAPEQFRDLRPAKQMTFSYVSSQIFNALVTRLAIPGHYRLRAMYVLDEGTLPNGVSVPGAWAGRLDHQTAFDVIAETADGSPLARHPGLIVLALFRDRLRPWLERQAATADPGDRQLYANAAQQAPHVAEQGSYSGADLLTQYVGRGRDVVGTRADLVAERRYDLYTLTVGSHHGNYVAFAIVLDGGTVVHAVAWPERGPVP